MAAAIVATNVAVPVARNQHRTTVSVHLVDELRAESADVARAMFPNALKRVSCVPGLHRTSISRSRAGDVTNPLYRLALWFLALRASGAPSERAALAIEYLQEVERRLWPVGELDEHALMLREQELDAEEDLWQLRYVLGVSGAREHYMETLREYRAVAGELLLAVEAHGAEVRS